MHFEEGLLVVLKAQRPVSCAYRATSSLSFQRSFPVNTIFALLAVLLPLVAQQKVDPARMYTRVLAVVPMIGTGTPADPKRPLFVQMPSELSAANARSGIIGFAYQLSDDGKFALVEFVAADPEALRPILTSTNPLVKAFERGKASKTEIETEFRKFKRDFDPTKFTVRVP
jgi:hypothetical protein